MHTAEVCGDQASKFLVSRSIAIPRSEEAIRSDAASAQSILPVNVFTNFSRFSAHGYLVCSDGVPLFSATLSSSQRARAFTEYRPCDDPSGTSEAKYWRRRCGLRPVAGSLS